MDNFLRYFYQDLGRVFRAFTDIFSSFFNFLNYLLNFPMRMKIIDAYSDDFGTMLCYRAHKEEYLRVNSKNDYFEHLEELPNEQRQETYVCPDFAVRDQCEGYRGFVEE